MGAGPTTGDAETTNLGHGDALAFEPVTVETTAATCSTFPKSHPPE
jgi:hypothetical protein